MSDSPSKVESYNIALNVAEQSLQQEQSRTATITEKSKNILKYIHSTMLIINALFAYLLKTGITFKSIQTYYISLMIPLVFSLLLAIRVERPASHLSFPLGEDVLKDLKPTLSKPHDTTIECLEYYISCISKYTESLASGNDTKSSFLIGAHITYSLTIIIAIIEAMLIIVIS